MAKHWRVMHGFEQREGGRIAHLILMRVPDETSVLLRTAQKTLCGAKARRFERPETRPVCSLCLAAIGHSVAANQPEACASAVERSRTVLLELSPLLWNAIDRVEGALAESRAVLPAETSERPDVQTSERLDVWTFAPRKTE